MIFHPLQTSISRPKKFTYPFCYEPHPLCIMAAREVQLYISSMKIWERELNQGKMFGVLIAEDANGQLGYYAAYSGILNGKNDWDFFVPPIYDMLKPDGYFKIHEEEISTINKKVAEMEHSPQRIALMNEIDDIRKEGGCKISEYREIMKEAKKRRDEKRSLQTEDESLIRESQFMKAELKRIKKRFSDNLSEKEKELGRIEREINKLKTERKRKSDELQHWLFSQFKILNAKGEERDLCSIFADTAHKTPPAGAGECCAPKLLQYAYLNHSKPICMAEFWWGKSPKAEIRHHLHYYPACQGKCKPILSHALQGLEIDANPLESYEQQKLEVLYDDEWMAAVYKPAGMLSVPGKSDKPSVESIARKMFNIKESPIIVHRLDMATSGIMLIAKTKRVHQNLQAQFKNHKIRKRYIALLDGVIKEKEGMISLPLRPDYMDRPRQIVDLENGKTAITEYQIIGVENGHTRIALSPHTGRTHQLRVHCAHQDGLDTPILGDTLYGKKDKRLYLQAIQIICLHPVTNILICIEKKEDF